MASSVRLKRPAIRYHGGKWLLAPWIISFFPEHKNYCEPFGGGGSVMLRKSRSESEVYNDLDDDVVNLFRVLRDPEKAKILAEHLYLTPFSRSEFRAAYDCTGSDIEQARKLMFRSYAGFSSTAYNRDERSMGFRYQSENKCVRGFCSWPAELQHISERLRGVIIENQDAFKVIELQDSKDTLFFVDPPYVHSTRNHGGRGYRFELKDEDHRRLAGILRSVEGKVVISGYPSEMYDRELYPGWRRETRASSSQSAKGAVPRTEVVWMNF